MSEWGLAIKRGPEASRAYFQQHPEEIHARTEQGYSPIGWAAWQGEVETVSILLELGAEMTPEVAVLLGMKDLVTEMLTADPGLATSYRVEADNFPLLWFAAIRGNIEMAELLLSYGADVNAAGGGVAEGSPIPPQGIRPLHGAAEHGHVSMIHLLMKHGADVNSKGRFGLTPLHQAAYKGRQEAAEVLLAYGADINTRTRDGETPLEKALQGKHTALAEWLRSRGAQE
jgi:ankyrin repeat protein